MHSCNYARAHATTVSYRHTRCHVCLHVARCCRRTREFVSSPLRGLSAHESDDLLFTPANRSQGSTRPAAVQTPSPDRERSSRAPRKAS